jgi:hypothetical protein
MSVKLLDPSESVCGKSISNAILWTHFVTPRGDQTQQDQTMWVSYHKKEESEESERQFKSFWPSRTVYFDVVLTCEG